MLRSFVFYIEIVVEGSAEKAKYNIMLPHTRCMYFFGVQS